MGTKGRNGLLIGAIQVQEGEEIMLISDQGTLVRTRVGEVSSLSRNTQGVTLIKLAADETLVGLERIQEPSEEELDELVEADAQGEAPEAVDDDSAGAEEAPQE
jgi:DNA gyrase subunit A